MAADRAKCMLITLKNSTKKLCCHGTEWGQEWNTITIQYQWKKEIFLQQQELNYLIDDRTHTELNTTILALHTFNLPSDWSEK